MSVTSVSIDPAVRTRTLLVGDVDGGGPLSIALELAADLGARVHVVHVLSLAEHPVDPELPRGREQTDRTFDEQRDMIVEAGGEAGVTCTYERRRGDPATELIAAAEQTDAMMIVVGSRGAGVVAALSRLVLPSVSHGVIDHQHRPVLVVPTDPSTPA